MVFLRAHSFFQRVFKNTNQKDIYAFIVFKAESKLIHEDQFLGVFSSKPKNMIFRGSKLVVLKLKFRICFLYFFFNVKGSFMPIFTKNINIQAPCNFLKLKTLPCVPKIWIWTSKIIPDLWLSAVFCQIKQKSLHPTQQLRQTVCLSCWAVPGPQGQLYQMVQPI